MDWYCEKHPERGELDSYGECWSCIRVQGERPHGARVMKKNMRKCPWCGRFVSTTAYPGEKPGPATLFVLHGPGPSGQMKCPGSASKVQ